MIKTQIQLPDALYHEAKRVAREREMSLAEVLRRGVEYMAGVYPPLPPTREKSKRWSLPKPINTRLKRDPFADEDWRVHLETEVGVAALKCRGDS